MSFTDQKIYILCHFANKSKNYSAWVNDTSLPCEIVEEFPVDWVIPDDAALVVTHMHYNWEHISKLRELYDGGRVPVLILADGVLEYRNTWEHPELAEGAIFQPLFGHKLACIGNSQARLVESWGNVGKCEVVGLPRLDQVTSSTSTNTTSEVKRILVATASTPAFDDSQRDVVKSSLETLKSWFDQHPSVDGTSIEVTWRLTDNLDPEVGLVDLSEEYNSELSFDQVLSSHDAVITTPSTIFLESALRGKPTAILDFHNCPRYIASAWNLNSPHQFDEVIPELLCPPPPKLAYQEFALHDQLECRTPAKARLLQLVDAMIECGNRCRVANQPVSLPARLLPDPTLGFQFVPEPHDLKSLYENQEVFKNDDLARLQIELIAAKKRLGELPLELAEKNRHINKLSKMLDRSRMRVEDMHNRVIAIRKRFGVQPAKPKMNGPDMVDDGKG